MMLKIACTLVFAVLFLGVSSGPAAAATETSGTELNQDLNRDLNPSDSSGDPSNAGSGEDADRTIRKDNGARRAGRADDAGTNGRRGRQPSRGETEGLDGSEAAGKKVCVCHVPASGNARTICVAPRAAERHLYHGDTPGECSADGSGDDEGGDDEGGDGGNDEGDDEGDDENVTPSGWGR